MTKSKELKYTDIRKEYNPDNFIFFSTADIEPSRNIIGQERAVTALEFGIKIKTEGYNIYMSGSSGEGKTSYALDYTSKCAKKMKTPNDWCYLYNFEKPNSPTAISLPAGTGKEFKKDMEEFVKVVEQEISKAFDGEDYEAERNNIVKEFQNEKDELIEKLNKFAFENGFKVKTTSTGIYFLPIIDGKTLNEEEYSQLDEDTKADISSKSELLQETTNTIVRKAKELEAKAEEAVIDWESKIALFAVGVHIKDLQQKYQTYAEIVDFLDKVQQDILDNLDSLRDDDTPQEQQMMLPVLVKRSEDSVTQKYKVNLLVDNSHLSGAPVIVNYNPTFNNLVGKVEYENEFGTLSTNHLMIKPGLIHQANNGYLILQIIDILNNSYAWEALKRTLKTGNINIENIKDQAGTSSISTLKPEPIPIKIKVILVGSSELYQLLYMHDRDFKKLFKIKADFDDSMTRNKKNVYKLAQFISAFCQKENSLPFDKTGVSGVVDYCTWLVEDQTKMTTKFNEIADILVEANAWAEIDSASYVNINHVKKAISEKINRSNKYDKRLFELLKDKTIMVDTEGEVVGQINGLSILSTGDYSFGKPSKITATTYIGKKGIINVEREIDMSGESHSKGILILSGYIGQKYAQDIPLSLSATVCFEQLYSGVDGDSASSTELYALLSSLSDLPIKQGLAVTGSVNQRGEIQPIGGATQKIEGFFELCKIRGLTGDQGVLIPYQNIKNLMLNDEVVQAVKDGLFHIYPVKTIDEGIQLLTGVKAGTLNADGIYPQNTVNYLVYEKLKKFAMICGYDDNIRNKHNT